MATALALSGCAGASGSNLSAQTLSGQRQMVFVTATIKPDCAPDGTVTLSLAAPPAHGHVDVAPATALADYAAGNPRAGCNGRRVAGLGIFYTSEPGFQDDDHFTVIVHGPDRQQKEVPVSVKVGPTTNGF